MQAALAQFRTDRHLWKTETRATLALALPLIAANLAQVAINATDVVMMGWLGPNALAAGALGSNLYFALMIFGIGIMTAAAPMIASELGRRSHSVRDVRRTVRQAFWTAATICVPFWLILSQTEILLVTLGQEPHLAVQAASYTGAMQWALFPTFLFVVLRIFISTLNRPRWALAIGILAIPFNAFANWCLMFGNLGMPALGLVGAGVGSVITGFFMLGALATVILSDRQFSRYHLFGRFWRADWPRYGELWRLGLPIGMTLAFEVLVFNAAVLLMGLFGTTALAAHSIALQIAAISFMVPLGFSQAVTVRVGRAYGAGDRDAVMRAGWTPFVMGVTFMASMALLMILFPHALIGVFLDRDAPANAEVVRLAVSFLAIAALFQVFDGAQSIAAGMLRGLRDTKMPMVYAALGYWVIGLSLGVILAFPLDLKGVGIWFGLAIGLAAVSAMMLYRWLRREKLVLGKSLPLLPV
ncbi:MATE efflux family protein [Parvibaculum lavamentivorans DS-1]|uniref:Multidrug-efflux transporter n=1 Tax=Parvibaculum lavamentivorans (strain DS-1 / DSM 13023 / NCIMB 13966) TaxID=402881 RepID=A7HTU5_PARL1|nr:MATE family efflux transporter [Parvibaculum lavamentivorans]ABS63328.1 MATE efflux family protein [Parvibaculum lavamentivorans DS-1]